MRSVESHTRLSTARQQFHHTVRGARRDFWALWQDHVSSLSARNLWDAASTIRRTFQGSTDPSHVEWVQWPHRPSGHDSATLWQEHFASVGAQSEGSFDETFHEEAMGRFSQKSSSREVGSFDDSFNPSELRRALGVCVDSAVCLDGVPYSLFQVPFPWWQRALLGLFNLVLSWRVIPTL